MTYLVRANCHNTNCGVLRDTYPADYLFTNAERNLYSLLFRVSSDRLYDDDELQNLFTKCEVVDDETGETFRVGEWRIRTDEISDAQLDKCLAGELIDVTEDEFLRLTESIETRERFWMTDLPSSDKRPDHNLPLHVNQSVVDRINERAVGRP